MYTDPVSRFFDGIVPAYKEYVELSNKKDNKISQLMQSAINTANLLYHFRETITPSLIDKAILRAELKKCNDYDLIGDVCNASKHNELTVKPKDRDLFIDKSSAIEETVVNTHFHIEGTKEPRQFEGVMDSRILITLLNGGTRDLLEVATNVINCWSDILFNHGLTKKYIKFDYHGDDILSHEQILAKGNTSPKFHVKSDGTTLIPMIARYFEPKDKTFKRWGFGANGTLIPVEIPENAPNAKTYMYHKSNNPQ